MTDIIFKKMQLRDENIVSKFIKFLYREMSFRQLDLTAKISR
jgi:hypothetical protein